MSDRDSTRVFNLREFMTISQRVTKCCPIVNTTSTRTSRPGVKRTLGGQQAVKHWSLSEGWRSVPPGTFLPMRRHARIAITRHFDKARCSDDRQRLNICFPVLDAPPHSSSQRPFVFISLRLIPRTARMAAQFWAVLGYNSGVLPVTECLHQCPGEPMTCREVTAARSQLIYPAFSFSIFCC